MTKKSPLFIIGTLFFVFGFVTWLNSVLIPFLKIACELNNFQSYFVTFAFYIAYFVLAIPSAGILEKIGYRRGMSVGLWIMAMGALVFVPAAMSRNFALFLVGLFLLGAGLALLQTASNPYAAIIGPMESAARRIGIMGVCNKIAGVIAPFFLSSLVLKDTDAIKESLLFYESSGILDGKELLLNDLARKCMLPYLCIAFCLFLLSVWIRKSSLPEISTSSLPSASIPPTKEKFSLKKYPQLIGGIVAIFFYVGAEVISIDTLINYAQSYDIPIQLAKMFPSFSMLALILGYFIGIWGIPKYFSQRTALMVSAILGVLLSILVLFFPGKNGLFILIWLGLANAMIWPSVWGLAIRDLGSHVSLGSSFLIMAIVGGALLPLLYGLLVDKIGFQYSYAILLPCYIIIFLYGLNQRRDVIKNENTKTKAN
ncbi:MAG: glucose/galactose MFS transporter [Bacteroidales bacterium]